MRRWGTRGMSSCRMAIWGAVRPGVMRSFKTDGMISFWSTSIRVSARSPPSAWIQVASPCHNLAPVVSILLSAIPYSGWSEIYDARHDDTSSVVWRHSQIVFAIKSTLSYLMLARFYKKSLEWKELLQDSWAFHAHPSSTFEATYIKMFVFSRISFKCFGCRHEWVSHQYVRNMLCQ